MSTIPATRDMPPASEHTHPSAHEAIVFYDGVCGMCNTFVDFCLKRDPQGRLKYAPLQGETARQLLPPELTENLTTVVFYQQGKILTHSTAVLAILQTLGYSRALTMPLWILPRFLRDLGYRSIASVRYRIFGKKEACRMPTREERARFLD